MIADPLWSCVMLLCGPLWVFCGSFAVLCGPLWSFAVLCGPLRYLVIPLGRSVHEEAHPCFPHLVQPSFKGIDAGSIYHPLVQLIPSIKHSV